MEYLDGCTLAEIVAEEGVLLLYLKTRKAGGESLQDASEQFEALDIPRSKWQARMKTRTGVLATKSTKSE